MKQLMRVDNVEYAIQTPYNHRIRLEPVSPNVHTPSIVIEQSDGKLLAVGDEVTVEILPHE